MSIKVSVGNASFEVPDRSSIDSAVKAKIDIHAAKESAKLLINSNQSFFLKDICPSTSGEGRKRFIDWLKKEFQVDIVPKIAGEKPGLRNPLIVQPYVLGTGGVKQMAPMPWEPDANPVKGGGVNKQIQPLSSVESAVEAAGSVEGPPDNEATNRYNHPVSYV